MMAMLIPCKMRITRWTLWLPVWLAAASLLEAAVADAPTPARRLAQQILQATGIRGGLIVHVGCGDGKLTAALHTHDGCLIQGWDTDVARIRQARKHVQSLGLYGQVAIDQLRGQQLPYIDNLVNLVVAEDLGEVSRAEVMRVLCPEGVAYLKQDGQWTKTVKLRPATIDDWTHYLHDASNNAVAHDSVVAPPRRLQWVGGPRYSRHHDRLSSISAVVSAGGRVFYIADEGSRVSILAPPKWRLIARDAFNGTILWKRSIGHWQTHLWPLKSGPAQLPRRLVASGDRVYVTLGIDAPVVALDAATGKTADTYAGTQATEEIILSDGVLFLLVNRHEKRLAYANDAAIRRASRGKFWDEAPRNIVAARADTGKVLWTREQTVLPGTLAADSKRVVFHDGQSVVALDRDKGQPLWQSDPVPRSAEIRSFFIPTLVLYQDVVLFAGGETAGMQTGSWYTSGKDTMTALSADTGKVLWRAYHPPSGYRSAEDLLVAGGLVWTGETTSGRAVGVFTGRDPHTGEVKSKFSPDVQTYWFHHRCYRGKATDNYLLMARAGTEFVDFRKQHWNLNDWFRGACLYGVMPANGLIYAPPHPCACYLEAKLSGFNALAPAGQSGSPSAGSDGKGSASTAAKGLEDNRIERGPAYDAVVTPGPAAGWSSSEDWPTYRHDAARSGRASTSVAVQLRPAWRCDLGGKLTSPVIAESICLVASVDTHTVHALDAASGKRLWSWTTGARVDSPPTVYQGRVLFGSADGWVYCLRAADGALAWRFRAGPDEKRLVSYEQVESVWPVHGSVLVQDGVVYCVAGRSMFLDGGLRLWRLDPKSGRVLSRTVLDNRDETGKDLHEYVSWLNMPPALPDVLSCDGQLVYMRSQPFHLDGTRLPLRPMPHARDADKGAPPPTQLQRHAHIFSPTGLLDDSWWHRTYWMYGSTFVSGWCGYYLAGQAAPAGRILALDDTTVYGFGRKPKYYRWTTPMEYQLFAADRALPNLGGSDREGKPVSRFKVKHRWTTDLPLLVRAMVLSGGKLFLAGPRDVVDEEQVLRRFSDPKIESALAGQLAALEGKKGALLQVVSTGDGGKLAEQQLASPPVFDGMAAASGRLYVSGQDGTVTCFGAR